MNADDNVEYGKDAEIKEETFARIIPAEEFFRGFTEESDSESD